MSYAIIQLGGKQLKVNEGDTFEIERQKALDFNVLAYSDGKNLEIGTPFLKDVKVKAKIIEEKRGKKVRVARFKSKSRYRRVQGHRQPLSVVKIEEISKGTKAKKASEKVPEKKTTEKKATKTAKKTTKVAKKPTKSAKPTKTTAKKPKKEAKKA